MSQAIRDAAQALLSAVDARHDQPAPLKYTVPYGAVNDLRAALSAPQPTADERVAEHMRLVTEVGGAGWACNSARLRAAELAVEQSARALLSASQEDAQMLDWLAAHVTEAPIDPKSFEHMEFPDTRLRWVLPMMPSWAEYCGQISFKEAVKIAMSTKETK